MPLCVLVVCGGWWVGGWCAVVCGSAAVSMYVSVLLCACRKQCINSAKYSRHYSSKCGRKYGKIVEYK